MLRGRVWFSLGHSSPPETDHYSPKKTVVNGPINLGYPCNPNRHASGLLGRLVRVGLQYFVQPYHQVQMRWILQW